MAGRQQRTRNRARCSACLAEIVQQARSLLSEQDVQAERYLVELRHELGRLEEERDTLKQERENAKAEAVRLARGASSAKSASGRKRLRNRLERWAEEFQNQGERFVKGVKDRFEAARLRKEMKQRQAALKEAFRRKITAETRTRGGSEPESGDRRPREPEAR